MLRDLAGLAGLTIEQVNSIGSTNTELLSRARKAHPAPQNTVLITKHQTQGRGREDKTWHSEVGTSALFSIGYRSRRKAWPGLSLVAGLAIVEALDPDDRLGLRLKWPNDLWIGNAKWGGILVETQSRPDAYSPSYVVVGVGLNISHAPQVPDCKTAALNAVWPDATVEKTLAQVLPLLWQNCQAFEQADFSAWHAHFEARNGLAGAQLQFRDGSKAQVCGVHQSGALCVQTAEGIRSIWHSNWSICL